MAITKCSPRKKTGRPSNPEPSKNAPGCSKIADSDTDWSTVSTCDTIPDTNNEVISELRNLKSHLLCAVTAVDKILCLFTCEDDIKIAEPLDSSKPELNSMPSGNDGYDDSSISEAFSGDARFPPQRVIGSIDPEPNKLLAAPRMNGCRPRYVPRASSGNIRGCSSHRNVAELFVTRLHPETQFAELRNYISQRIQSDFKLERISHINSYHQSFVLYVNLCHISKIMSPSFWPRNVECRHFKRPMSGRLARPSGRFS
jgi:hypothetical protein